MPPPISHALAPLPKPRLGNINDTPSSARLCLRRETAATEYTNPKHQRKRYKPTSKSQSSKTRRAATVSSRPSQETLLCSETASLADAFSTSMKRFRSHFSSPLTSTCSCLLRFVAIHVHRNELLGHAPKHAGLYSRQAILHAKPFQATALQIQSPVAVSPYTIDLVKRELDGGGLRNRTSRGCSLRTTSPEAEVVVRASREARVRASGRNAAGFCQCNAGAVVL